MNYILTNVEHIGEKIKCLCLRGAPFIQVLGSKNYSLGKKESM